MIKFHQNLRVSNKKLFQGFGRKEFIALQYDLDRPSKSEFFLHGQNLA